MNVIGSFKFCFVACMFQELDEWYDNMTIVYNQTLASVTKLLE